MKEFDAKARADRFVDSLPAALEEDGEIILFPEELKRSMGELLIGVYYRGRVDESMENISIPSRPSFWSRFLGRKG